MPQLKDIDPAPALASLRAEFDECIRRLQAQHDELAESLAETAALIEGTKADLLTADVAYAVDFHLHTARVFDEHDAVRISGLRGSYHGSDPIVLHQYLRDEHVELAPGKWRLVCLLHNLEPTK